MRSLPAYGLIYLTKGKAPAVAHFDGEGTYIGTTHPEEGRIELPYLNKYRVVLARVDAGVYVRKGVFHVKDGKTGWQFVERVLDEDDFAGFLEQLPELGQQPIMVEIPRATPERTDLLS